MRVFVGIALPERAVEPVVALQTELGVGRRVLEENLHLTLFFAGEITLEQAEEFHEGLAAIAVPRLRLEFAGVELFGAPERPDLVALGLRENAGLRALQAKVAGAARGAGIAAPRKRFHPHLTLARFGPRLGEGEAVRLGRFLEARGDVVLAPVEVEGFAMIRSRLGHGAPRYEVLAEYRL
ncbi:MAG: RNA 2',3'-cyclic phosphodiesterase [Paenirhodobacter sp.]|uniref:RNA 2',3'-cyclic phosphodiesterase n=1 Tax=Paenirhodobacter sp. TaxID=1965326 RepID=UPI003D0E191B